MEPQILAGKQVHVRDDDGHRSLRAKRSFKKGDPILEVRGDTLGVASRYSIQVSTDLHIEPGVLPSDLAHYDDYLWPFLNHSFDPNSMMIGRTLVAICDIRLEEELTFNYNGNEWEMATPFQCMETSRWVRGYKHLNAEERAEIREITSPFILELASEASVPQARLRGVAK